MTTALDASSVETGVRIGGTTADFLVHTSDGRTAIVEVRTTTPSTRTRLDSVARQLAGYREAYRAQTGDPTTQVDLILAIPGALADEQATHLEEHGITRVLDGPTLRASAPDLHWPDAVAESVTHHAQGSTRVAEDLVGRLEQTAPGRPQWSAYQKLVGEILGYLLVPPLAQPISERANESKVNRRDFILPNYATDGYWHFMRVHYEAHYVVADAKNYVGNVKKNEVLQLANYLSPHGAGLFGLIVCRRATDRSAEVTRREQWVLHRKMIVVLNDADLRQMIEFRATAQDPAEVLRQKIEDFRLSM